MKLINSVKDTKIHRKPLEEAQIDGAIVIPVLKKCCQGRRAK